jgi:hypothetical protein|tara:strand:+ start:668 stop:910 length:243 start_codon:yes stop_codon:yes gene_type:complete
MVYKTVYTEVEVEVDISDFDTEDLLDELESRGEKHIEIAPISRYEAAFLRSLLDQARATGITNPPGVSLWDLDEKIKELT